MIIGFDLDKIFINHPPLIPDKIMEYLYKKKSKKELAYRIPSRFEQYIRIFSHHSIFRPAIQGNIDFLKKNKIGKIHTYILVSSRFSFLKDRTEAIIKKYNLLGYFQGLYFNHNDNQPHYFKNDMIKKLHIERFVDDDLELLKFLSEKNKERTFFWFNTKEDRKIAHNLFAITNLEKIIKHR